MATLATKQSVMSVMASGATVCINTLCTLVYRKTPIWLQQNAVRHAGDPWDFFQMENITGLFAKQGDSCTAVNCQVTDKTTL